MDGNVLQMPVSDMEQVLAHEIKHKMHPRAPTRAAGCCAKRRTARGGRPSREDDYGSKPAKARARRALLLSGHAQTSLQAPPQHGTTDRP